MAQQCKFDGLPLRRFTRLREQHPCDFHILAELEVARADLLPSDITMARRLVNLYSRRPSRQR
jgi:hypothetical protein